MATEDNSVVGRRLRHFPVTTDLDNSEISVIVNELTGQHAGPTLAIVSGLHGSEWLAPIANTDLLQHIDLEALHGKLLVVPVANPIAFASGTRNIRDESDSPDLNRSFGGKQTWLADQIARVISQEVLEGADAVIDFHTGPWGAAMDVVACPSDYSNADLNEKSLGLAKAFGRPFIRRGPMVSDFPGPKSMIGYAGEVLGVPGIVAEVGGVGFDLEVETAWKRILIDGVLDVMAHLGMLERPAGNASIAYVGAAHRVNPSQGGMVEALLGADRLMSDVAEGELLGRVWSPYTFDVIEELRAPVAGILGMVPTNHPARPGDWAYLVFERTQSPG